MATLHKIFIYFQNCIDCISPWFLLFWIDLVLQSSKSAESPVQDEETISQLPSNKDADHPSSSSSSPATAGGGESLDEGQKEEEERKREEPAKLAERKDEGSQEGAHRQSSPAEMSSNEPAPAPAPRPAHNNPPDVHTPSKENGLSNQPATGDAAAAASASTSVAMDMHALSGPDAAGAKDARNLSHILKRKIDDGMEK